MAQTSHHQTIATQVSTARVKGLLSAQHSLALRRLFAWGLEVSFLVGSVALPWGLGEAVRQHSRTAQVPLNSVSSLVQGVIARPLGRPRQPLVTAVPPLTNLLWFSATVFPLMLIGGHLHRLATTGKSWPKAWLGLQVVALNSSVPGYRSALIREGLGRLGLPLGTAYLVWIGSGAFPALPVLGGLALTWALLLGATGLTDRSRRAGHDYLAGTRVLLLRGGQLPSKHQPEPGRDVTSGASSAIAVATSLFPFTRPQLLTMTEEKGGLRAIVLAPLIDTERMPPLYRWPYRRALLVLAGLVGGMVVVGMGWLSLRQVQGPTVVGLKRDALYLALVENLSRNAKTFSDQQAAALALASSQDPRAIPLLVDLLAQTGDPALLETLQQALVTLGPPAIPHLHRLNLALANDMLALPADQQLVAERRQQAVKRTLAKILVLHSGHLSGVDLSGTHLNSVKDGPAAFTLVLEQQHLAGLLWRNALLTGARFRKAILFDPGPDRRVDTFDDWIADFSGSDLTAASLVAAQLRRVNFRHTSLLRANLSNAQADYADFSGANASSAWFIAATINHGQFQGSSLVGADLTGAQLNQANFLEARLAQATLAGAGLNQANLTRAHLSGADLSEASLQSASLVQANLSGSRLVQADLSHANLAGANLQGADLQGTQLTGAHLAGANLSGARFFTAEPSQGDGFIRSLPDFEGTRTLVGVDFSNVLHLEGEQLDYVCQQGGLHPDCARPR